MLKSSTVLVRRWGGRVLGLGLLSVPLACGSSHVVAAGPQAAAPEAPKVTATAVVAKSATSPVMPVTPAAPVAPAPPAAPLAQLPPTTTTTTTAATTTATPPGPLPPAPPVPAPPPRLAINIVDERPFLGAIAHTTRTTRTTTTTTTTNTHDVTPPSNRRSRHTPPPPPRRRGRRHEHPDPRIIVDVKSVKGNVQQADVQRQARAKGWGLIKSCYEEGLRRNQRLNGSLGFEVTIGADGNVSTWNEKGASLTDASVNLCVVREISRLGIFTADNASANVEFQVFLSPGDDPVPVPHIAPRADTLASVLRSRWAGVEVCYREGLERHADIGGRMEMRFRVRPAGDVADVVEGDTHFADADVSRCVLDVYRNTKFRKVAGRHDETFVYALHLEASPELTKMALDDARNDRDDDTRTDNTTR